MSGSNIVLLSSNSRVFAVPNVAEPSKLRCIVESEKRETRGLGLDLWEGLRVRQQDQIEIFVNKLLCWTGQFQMRLPGSRSTFAVSL
jgi:hypothetical protein